MGLLTSRLRLVPALLLACGVVAHPADGAAEQILKTSDLRVDVTLTNWLTEGKTRWSFYNQSPRFGNPTSELDYKDVGTTVTELGGKVSFAKHFFVRGQYGYGAVGGGRLVDDDYVSAAGATFYGTTQSGAHRFSRTFSDVDGSHLWYLNADLGAQSEVWQGRALLGAFLGYQHREEKLQAFGVGQVECTALVASAIQCNPAGTVTHVNQLVLTNASKWDSFRLGVDGDVRLHPRFSLDGRATFLVSWLKNKDIHHLRTDLKQDPSITLSGNGIGFNGEANAGVLVYDQLFFNVGYRYWWQRVSSGDVVFRGTSGDSQPLPLNEFRSIRQGITFGFTYKF